MHEKIVKRLQEVPGSRDVLKKGDLTLTEDVANDRTKIATFTADPPIALREDRPLRLAFVVCEEFQTDNTADNQETFNLSNDAIDAEYVPGLVLYEGSDLVQPDSVDYENNNFDYTDDGTENYLHAFYTVAAQNRIEIEVSAPRSQGNVSHVVFDEAGSMLHRRNQNKSSEAPRFDFDHPLERMVPKKWSVDIYAEGSVAYSWDDSDEANSQGVSATNAIVSLPIVQSAQNVEGLAPAVRDVITNPGRGR